jgi:signal transduction histidine kinase
MLKETLQLFRHHSRSIVVSMDVDDSYAPHIHPHIDREAVRSVVWNLLVNAAQAMNAPERGPLQPEEPVMDFPLSSPISSATNEFVEEGDLLIDVRLHMSDELMHIIIEDNGQGISQADSEHIFEPFFTTKDSGTGLGLATAFRIIDEHGGQMTLQPPRRLHGASFELTLPKNLSPTQDHTT